MELTIVHHLRMRAERRQARLQAYGDAVRAEAAQHLALRQQLELDQQSIARGPPVRRQLRPRFVWVQDVWSCPPGGSVVRAEDNLCYRKDFLRCSNYTPST